MIHRQAGHYFTEAVRKTLLQVDVDLLDPSLDPNLTTRWLIVTILLVIVGNLPIQTTTTVKREYVCSARDVLGGLLLLLYPMIEDNGRF